MKDPVFSLYITSYYMGTIQSIRECLKAVQKLHVAQSSISGTHQYLLTQEACIQSCTHAAQNESVCTKYRAVKIHRL